MIPLPLAFGLSVLIVGAIKVLGNDKKETKQNLSSEKPKNKNVGEVSKRKDKGKSKNPVSKLPEKIVKQKESENNDRKQRSETNPERDTGKSQNEPRQNNEIRERGSFDSEGKTNENPSDDNGGDSGISDLEENEIEKEEENETENQN